MASSSQKGLLISRLTEVDASSGYTTRIYTLTSYPRSKVYLKDHHTSPLTDGEQIGYTTQLSEGPGVFPQNTASPSETQVSGQINTSTWSLSSLIWSQYEALKSYLSALFLPTGYPHSVTADYTPYQIYDSLQAFASSIAGLLSSRAVLQSLNVLDSTSSTATTATAATLLSIVQSTLSNLTTILFASHAAPRINTEVKYYRFLADIVNDAAFVLDLLAPSLPTSFPSPTMSQASFPLWTTASIAIGASIWAFVTPRRDYSSSNSSLTSIVLFGILSAIVAYVTLFGGVPLSLWILKHLPSPRTVSLCLSSVLRAMCGVAGGSSKAVLSSHFARNNPENIGDLNAKDGSQETVIGLMGMWFGGVVVSRVEGRNATWFWMLSLLAAHLSCNWKAVQSVRLCSLNRQRATLVCDVLLQKKADWKTEIKVERIGAKESVLGLRDAFKNGLRCEMGVSLKELLKMAAHINERKLASDTTVANGVEKDLLKLLNDFKDEQYVMAYDSTRRTATVILKTTSKPVDQFKAWLYASIAHKQFNAHTVSSSSDNVARLLSQVNEMWEEVCMALSHSGWDLDMTNLEVVKGLRLQVDT